MTSAGHCPGPGRTASRWRHAGASAKRCPVAEHASERVRTRWRPARGPPAAPPGAPGARRPAPRPCRPHCVCRLRSVRQEARGLRAEPPASSGRVHRGSGEGHPGSHGSARVPGGAGPARRYLHGQPSHRVLRPLLLLLAADPEGPVGVLFGGPVADTFLGGRQLAVRVGGVHQLEQGQHSKKGAGVPSHSPWRGTP